MTAASRPAKSPAILALLQRSRVDRGLPYHVTDKAVLARVAQMVKAVQAEMELNGEGSPARGRRKAGEDRGAA